jgi:acetyl esterase/lipase
MAIASATDVGYQRLREHLARTGLVVVGVEFRNSAGKLGPHPFPAGLNDCASAIRWVAANQRDLGISHLVVNAESGGGNLTLTVGHKAKREGWLHEIAGFYAICRFISNRWHEPPDDLASRRECDGYFISLQQAQILGSIYDPDKSHWDDPTCFAGVATDEDMKGLPPHVISVNELDPMRDEGPECYRRLLRAGVAAVGRMVAGTCHGGDLLFPGDVSVSRSGSADVITPNPAAERKVPVPGGVPARLPGNGMWAVADDHLVGHVVVLRGVLVVIHRDPEDLAGGRHRLAVESFSYPTCPVDSGVRRGVGKDVEHCFGRCGVVIVATIVSLVMSIQTDVVPLHPCLLLRSLRPHGFDAHRVTGDWCAFRPGMIVIPGFDRGARAAVGGAEPRSALQGTLVPPQERGLYCTAIAG